MDETTYFGCGFSVDLDGNTDDGFAYGFGWAEQGYIDYGEGIGFGYGHCNFGRGNLSNPRNGIGLG